MAEFQHKPRGDKQFKQSQYEALDLHQVDGVTAGEVIIVSRPPVGCYRVVNIYAVKVGQNFKLKVEFDDTPVT